MSEIEAFIEWLAGRGERPTDLQLRVAGAIFSVAGPKSWLFERIGRFLEERHGA